MTRPTSTLRSPLLGGHLALTQHRLYARDVLAHLAHALTVRQLTACRLEAQVEHLLACLFDQPAKVRVSAIE
jgi:hypothetical protein